MKKVNLFIGMLLYVMAVSAQTNYYSITKVFIENGYTYQCDVPAYKMVSLYNKDYKWIHSKQVYKDTGEIFMVPESGIDFVQPGIDYYKCHIIVDNAFSVAEKKRMRGYSLSISMYINPNTGRADDVLFRFLSVNPLATIPVSVYRKIELDLKKQVWFIYTLEGKKLNYIYHGWRQKFKW